MSVKKVLKYLLLIIIVVAGLLDAYRYLQPGNEEAIVISNQNSITAKDGKKIIMIYNAYGGIYPGLLDIVHKELFPGSYPCNLCLQAFGSFGPKPEWTRFLDSLPYEKEAYHKENFKKDFLPQKLRLPAILLQSDTKTELLLSASEINNCRNLNQLINKIREKLK